MIKEIVPDLSHCCKESLSVEESSHPESNGSAIEAPGMELAVSVNQLCKPEPKGTGIPWNLSQNREKFKINSNFKNLIDDNANI